MRRRILCGIVILLLLSVTVWGAETAEAAREPDYVWLYLPLEAEPREEIWLYTAGGDLVDRLLTDENGRANSGLLPPGKYYAATLTGCTFFALKETLEVEIIAGRGHFENGTLYLTP